MARIAGYLTMPTREAAEAVAEALNAAHVDEHGPEDTYTQTVRGGAFRTFTAPRKPLVSVMEAPPGYEGPHRFAVKVPEVAVGYHGRRGLNLTPREPRLPWADWEG